MLTKRVASVANELSPLGCLDLPLVRQLDVVPPREAVLQVPLRLSMPAQQFTSSTEAPRCAYTYHTSSATHMKTEINPYRDLGTLCCALATRRALKVCKQKAMW